MANKRKRKKPLCDRLGLKIPKNLKFGFHNGIFLKINYGKHNTISETYILTALPTEDDGLNSHIEAVWLYNFVCIQTGIRLTATVKDSWKPKSTIRLIKKLINGLDDYLTENDTIKLIRIKKRIVCRIYPK